MWLEQAMQMIWKEYGVFWWRKLQPNVYKCLRAGVSPDWLKGLYQTKKNQISLQISRLRRTGEILGQNRPQIHSALGFTRRIILDRTGKMLYRQQDPEENTYYIGNRCNQRINIGIPDDGDKGIYLQATGPAGINVIAGSDPQDFMDVTYTFYTLTLKASEAEIVQEAEFTAADRLAAADTAIKKMDRGLELLPTRLALRDLFSKACKELEKGREYVVAARLTDGVEQRYLYGKALTCYVRAESKFREVYNYIHPPAEKPEDLGLEPIEPPRPELKTFEERSYRQILEEGI